MMPTIKWPNEVVYHIFPDRWCNADPSNDVRTGEYKWHGHPVRKSTDVRRLTSPLLHQYYFYGGDLAGVTEKIPYFKRLGVTVVYLNPIFTSPSSHKYDADDYFTVDPHLGTRADYERMVAALHTAGIKIVLDGVFNHTSFHHPWYVNPRIRKKFYCMKNATETMTWMNGGHLPKLNPENPAVEKALLSVIDAWPEIDGWRLDAAHLLPVKFLQKLKRRVERLGDRNIIIMEDWTDSHGHFHDEVCDGVTNFLFRDAVERFLVEDCSAETILKRFACWILRYPWPNVVQSWNLLDNHDTFRIFSRVGRNVARFRIAQALQFTLPGTPMIYQGDEIGMTARTDAQSRSPMIWDEKKWNREIFEHTQKLIALRKHHPVLQAGRWRPLLAVNHARALAYERTLPSGDRAVIAINDGYRPFDFRSGKLRSRLAPHDYAIWISDRHGSGRLA